MEELSLKDIISKYNTVIPEIQREYVWGLNRDHILENFLNEIHKWYNEHIEFQKRIQNEVDEKIKVLIDSKGYTAAQSEIEELKKGVDSDTSKNIGFLYLYKPAYSSPYSEKIDYHLIDGQQRLTTLFLLWFYLSVKNDRKKDFAEAVRISESKVSLAFNYRVRYLTQKFLKAMIENISTVDDIISMEHKSWFLSHYKSDATITAFVSAFKHIHEEFIHSEEGLTDYVFNQIKLWLFTTNVTKQGEELYITMNSRGKATSTNESVRAKLFEEGEDNRAKIRWSKSWEEWQDIFWKKSITKKDAKKSADDGMDSFLASVAGLEGLLKKDAKNEKTFLNTSVFKEKGFPAESLAKNLSMEILQKYFVSLSFITDPENIASFKVNYNYSTWIDNAIDAIWSIFNKNESNWLADYTDSKNRIVIIEMVYLWSLFRFLGKIELRKENIDIVYRALRIFYMRFLNKNRGYATIEAQTDDMAIKGVWSFHSPVDEENIKHLSLKKIDDEQKLRQIEAQIWQLEDFQHEKGLNSHILGEKAIDSSHLFDYSEPLEPNSLTKIFNRFKSVFSEKGYSPKLMSLLLYYDGAFWSRVSPWYYENYEFNYWKEIIRHSVFEQFFKEFLNYDGDITSLLDEKKDFLFVDDNADNLRLQLLWYFKHIGIEMWSQGGYIAISLPDSYCALDKYGGKEKDKVFSQRNVIFNTKGFLQGGNPTPLFELLPEEIKKQYHK